MEYEIYVPWLFYSQIILGCMNCLIRVDFNVVYSLLCYYIWRVETGKSARTKLLWLNIGVITVDAIWFFVASYLWSQKAVHDEYLWESLSGLHKMALFFSFINLVTRGAVIGFLYMIIKEGEQAQPISVSPPRIAGP